MTTTTQTADNQVNNLPKRKEDKTTWKMKMNFYSFVIDFLVWSYLALVSWKIVWEKLILGLRYPDFTWNQPLIALAIGFAISAILYKTKMSLGRGITGIMKRDENTPFMKEPFSFVLIATVVLTFIASIYISQISIYEFLSEPRRLIPVF